MNPISANDGNDNVSHESCELSSEMLSSLSEYSRSCHAMFSLVNRDACGCRAGVLNSCPESGGVPASEESLEAVSVVPG